MPKNSNAKLTVGLVGATKTTNGVAASSDRTFRLEFPGEVDQAGIMRATRDIKTILDSLERAPEQHARLQNALLEQDLPTVFHLVDELGISEERLVAAGGGQAGVVIVIAIACALLLKSDNPQ